MRRVVRVVAPQPIFHPAVCFQNRTTRRRGAHQRKTQHLLPPGRKRYRLWSLQPHFRIACHRQVADSKDQAHQSRSQLHSRKHPPGKIWASSNGSKAWAVHESVPGVRLSFHSVMSCRRVADDYNLWLLWSSFFLILVSGVVFVESVNILAYIKFSISLNLLWSP